MGIFSNIGKDVELAAGIALVVVGGPLGIMAGSMMIGQFVGSSGILGKSIQNFSNSAAANDLVMAAGLASAAVGIEGMVSNAGESATSAAVNQGVAQVNADPTMAALQNPAAASTMAAAQTDAAATVNGTVTANAPGSVNLAQTLQQGNNALTIPGLDEQAVQTANNTAASMTSNPDGVNPPQDVPQANASTSAASQMNAVSPNSNASPGATPPGATPPGTTPAATPPGTPPQSIGQKAYGALTSTPGMLMAGQAVSGLGQGIANQKMMQEQIAAQQWGNMQWEQPGQVANLQAAAAAPITVPQGYLNRAAAVRTMMNGSTNQTAPLSGGPTGAAPPPMAPVGMQQAPAAQAGGAAASGPVPVYQMNATPKGGVI